MVRVGVLHRIIDVSTGMEENEDAGVDMARMPGRRSFPSIPVKVLSGCAVWLGRCLYML